MRPRWETAASALLTVAAIAIAVVLVRREFFVPSITRAPQDEKPVYVASWREMLPVARLVGDSGASIKIVEFADFECPFCRRFSSTFREVRRRHPDDVALFFVHLPLLGHRFARPAARAAECANAGGRFAEMVEAIYESQDSLGLKPWTWYAKTAQVEDTVRFVRCIAETGPMQAVEAGVQLAEKMGVSATPTIFVNGWRYAGALTPATLDRIIEALRAGKRPYVSLGEGEQ